MISNTPPRCGANRHSATRLEINNRSGTSDVMSVHPYVPHTRCSIEFRPIRLYTPSARLDFQQHCTVCERFPREDMLSLLRLTRSKYFLRSKSHRPAHRRPAVCHLWESAEVLFTEHINHWVPEAIPPFQVSLTSWEPIVPSSSSDLQPHGQPIIDEPIINGAMQEIVKSVT